jgi:hypothetical protein
MARLDCYWGQSGTGKSEGVASVIEQIYRVNGLTSRVIVGDGSRATYEDRGLVDAKVVEIVDFSIRPYPQTTLSLLCQGYWPVDLDDPQSPLQKPTFETLRKLGVFAVEGLSVASQYLMGDIKGGLAEQSSRGIKIGQDSPVLAKDVMFDKTGAPIKGSGPKVLDENGKVIEDIYSYGGNPIAHYSFAQRRILADIEATKVFPGLVIWTAHERSAQDKISGEKIVGPEGPGEAMTANLPRHFNNTLHFVTAAKASEKVKDTHTGAMVKDLDVEYRVYTRDHFHPDGNTFTKYKAVTRGASEEQGMPLYLTSDKPGQAVLDFYQKIVDLREARAESLRAGTKTTLSELVDKADAA